jgi:hypothetical protein
MKIDRLNLNFLKNLKKILKKLAIILVKSELKKFEVFCPTKIMEV